MQGNSVPFDLFWENYGTFQLQTPLNDWSVNSSSFENIPAMREACRQTIEIQNLIDGVNSSANFPRICSCPTISIASLNPMANQKHTNSCSNLPTCNPYANLHFMLDTKPNVNFFLGANTSCNPDAASSVSPLTPVSRYQDSPFTPTTEIVSPCSSPPGSFENYSEYFGQDYETPKYDLVHRVHSPEMNSMNNYTQPRPQVNPQRPLLRANSAPSFLSSNNKKEVIDVETDSIKPERNVPEHSVCEHHLSNGRHTAEKNPRYIPYVKQRRKSYEKIMCVSGLDNHSNNISPTHVEHVHSPQEKEAHTNVVFNTTPHKRFDWKPELHRHFIQAYETISRGGSYPTPAKIMVEMYANGAGSMMEGLTRVQVNSHLTKYEQALVLGAPKRQSKFSAFRTKNAIPQANQNYGMANCVNGSHQVPPHPSDLVNKNANNIKDQSPQSQQCCIVPSS